jgi:hypothetical protein
MIPGSSTSGRCGSCSTGTITVHSFSCDASKIQIHFSVDATLASEFAGGPTMDVTGTFEATFPAASCP